MGNSVALSSTVMHLNHYQGTKAVSATIREIVAGKVECRLLAGLQRWSQSAAR